MAQSGDEFSGSSVAGALCMLATGGWAKSFEQHMELAAAAYDQCCNGFAHVEITEAASLAIVEAIKSCSPKKKGKK